MVELKVLLVLTLFVAFIAYTKAYDYEDDDDYLNDQISKASEASVLSKEQKIALTRDWLGRDNPDEFAYGFFPPWVVLMLRIAAFFFVLAVISGLFVLLGCRSKNPNHVKQRHQSSIHSLPTSKIGLYRRGNL